MKMPRIFIFTIIVSLLSSCASVHGDRKDVVIDLEGEKLDICEDAPVFEIIYANDTVVMTSLLSNRQLIGAYSTVNPDEYYEFLNVGRGPMEVLSANMTSRSDTIHVLSYNPFGIVASMRIPVADIHDMSKWEYTDYSAITDMRIVGGFAVKSPSDYVILGDKFDEKNIISSLSRGQASYVQSGFWPEDGYDDSVLVKQFIYMLASKVFSNGDKVLYVCGEGRYASILDLASSAFSSEHKIYDEYPLYKVDSDGVNWKRLPKSKIGMMAFATDSLIYLSPIECRLVDGEYVPGDYKGYPPFYNDRIEVYGWDGDYEYTYRLDVPFSTFYVREDDSCLYTVTTNLETLYTEIYRYDLK